MPYLYLSLSVVFISSGGIFGGLYNRKNKDRTDPIALYNLVAISTVLLCWGVLYAIDFSFDAKVLYFAIPMGFGYWLATYANIYALKYGPVSLTALFLQLSLIGVTVWGFFFWGEKVTVYSVLGLVLAVASLVLCLYEKKEKGQEKTKISKTWLLFAVLLFVGNMASGILQRTQQMKYDGQHGNMLMVFAMAIAFFCFLVLYLKSEKKDSVLILKQSGWLPMSYGVMNVGLNLFMILLATSSIPPSLVYPVISVGGIAINSIASVFLFKEKLSWWQWLGIAVGALAVVFLSV